MTVPSTLADIRTKFRRVTAAPSSNQITDADIDDYVQTFYVQDFPEHLKLFNLKETYTFTTEANIDVYEFDRNQYVSIQPPLFVDGYQSFWSQNREQFYRVWPKIVFQSTAGQGDGTAGPYTFTVANRPVLRAQQRFNRTFDSDIIVCAEDANENTMSLIDDGGFLDFPNGPPPPTGRLIDANYSLDIPPTNLLDPTLNRGTVDYVDGSFTFTFPNPVPGDNLIRISSVPYTSGRPTSVLFFDDKFIVRPVPNTCYKISIEAWRNPIALLAASSSPELNEWWQVIALGAALKFFEDRGNFEDYAKYTAIFEKYKLLVQRRTIVQQTNQRTSSIYEDQTVPGLYQNFFGGRF